MIEPIFGSLCGQHFLMHLASFKITPELSIYDCQVVRTVKRVEIVWAELCLPDRQHVLLNVESIAQTPDGHGRG